MAACLAAYHRSYGSDEAEEQRLELSEGSAAADTRFLLAPCWVTVWYSGRAVLFGELRLWWRIHCPSLPSGAVHIGVVALQDWQITIVVLIVSNFHLFRSSFKRRSCRLPTQVETVVPRHSSCMCEELTIEEDCGLWMHRIMKNYRCRSPCKGALSCCCGRRFWNVEILQRFV